MKNVHQRAAVASKAWQAAGWSSLSERVDEEENPAPLPVVYYYG